MTHRASDARPVSYFLETSRDPVERQGALWKKPLPMAARPAAASLTAESPDSFCYGNYFEAAHEYLVRDNCRLLIEAVRQRSGKGFEADRLRHINVFLVKHGEFYHPARVEIQFDEQRLNFVLNVAVSDAGRHLLTEEIRCLTRLGQHPAAEYIPSVYGHGDVVSPSGPNLLMWLGEWFDDFHEFHWTESDPGGNFNLGIWDPNTGIRYLNAHQTGFVFRQAAAILTHFLDLTTFEQIHPWHHAAGDFVIRQQHDRIDVRLVTVRGYTGMLAAAPPADAPGHDANLTLQMMLLFLLKLSLRMRLDRVDGVGDPVWADETVVPHTVAGFRSALANKPQPAQLPDAAIRCFDAYMAQCQITDLVEILEAVIDAYPDDHPEKKILIREFQTHAAVLFQTVADSLGEPA